MCLAKKIKILLLVKALCIMFSIKLVSRNQEKLIKDQDKKRVRKNKFKLTSSGKTENVPFSPHLLNAITSQSIALLKLKQTKFNQI